MAETTTIDLRDEAKAFGKFSRLLAEWWDANSKFAVVRGTTKSDDNFELRLDLDKHAFLDHAASPFADAMVQAQVGTITDLIIAKKARQRLEQLGKNSTPDYHSA